MISLVSSAAARPTSLPCPAYHHSKMPQPASHALPQALHQQLIQFCRVGTPLALLHDLPALSQIPMWRQWTLRSLPKALLAVTSPADAQDAVAFQHVIEMFEDQHAAWYAPMNSAWLLPGNSSRTATAVLVTTELREHDCRF